MAIKIDPGSIVFAFASSAFAPIIEAARAAERRENLRRLDEMRRADPICYCEHAGRTMTRREHARYHASKSDASGL